MNSPRFSTLFRAVGAFILVSSLLLGTHGAARAQDSDPGLISSTDYESFVYGYFMSWADPWFYVSGSAKSDLADEITLQSQTGYLAVYLVHSTDFTQAELLDEMLAIVQNESSNYVELARGEESDHLSVTVEYTNPSGAQVKQYVEVNVITALDGSEALSAISLRSGINDFDSDWASVEENIVRDGTDFVFRGLPDGLSRGLGIRGPDDKPREPVVKGGTFRGGQYTYKVTWDKKLWDGDRMEPPAGVEGYEGVNLNSSTSEGWVEVLADFGGDPRACVTAWGDHLQSLTTISSFREETAAVLPKTGSDVVATLYAYTFTSDNGDKLELAEYTECRVLVAGNVVMRVTFVAPIADYESLIPSWEDVLKGIEITTK